MKNNRNLQNNPFESIKRIVRYRAILLSRKLTNFQKKKGNILIRNVLLILFFLALILLNIISFKYL